jgi:hypothetical protein
MDCRVRTESWSALSWADVLLAEALTVPEARRHGKRVGNLAQASRSASARPVGNWSLAKVLGISDLRLFLVAIGVETSDLVVRFCMMLDVAVAVDHINGAFDSFGTVVLDMDVGCTICVDVLGPATSAHVES